MRNHEQRKGIKFDGSVFYYTSSPIARLYAFVQHQLHRSHRINTFTEKFKTVVILYSIQFFFVLLLSIDELTGNGHFKMFCRISLGDNTIVETIANGQRTNQMIKCINSNCSKGCMRILIVHCAMYSFEWFH